MAQAHLQSLQKKHAVLEDKIQRESSHAARNDQIIRRLKEQKLLLKERIERMERVDRDDRVRH